MSTSQDQTPPADPGADSYPYGPWEPEPPSRRSWKQMLRNAVLTALIVAVTGVVLGVLWHFVAPRVPVLDAGQGGIVVNDPSPEEYVAADGWFTLLGFAFGVVAAVVAWMVRRRDRGPALLLAVTAGAYGAALVAWQAGQWIGRSAYESWRDSATTGGTFHAPPELHTHGVLLVPAFAAAIVMTLLAGWSNDPDLDQPGARPGYGHDLQHPDLQHPEPQNPESLNPESQPPGRPVPPSPSDDLPSSWARPDNA